ncbi:MAG TPA: arginase [Firmicutes bacterium]|jgi:arginase|nr:arginase [Bacillota bacterium]
MKKTVDIIGVPVDFGANKRGVDMGPAAIRYTGLYHDLIDLGFDCRDRGNILVPIIPHHSLNFSQELNQTYQDLADMVYRSLADQSLPLILGGDHSIAIGSLTGVQKMVSNLGVIWLDAHSDFNNQNTSITGNLHGMPLAICSGFGTYQGLDFKCCLQPKNVVIIALRSVDKAEAELLKQSGVTVFTMEDIDFLGMREVMKRSLEIVSSHTEGIHLSFDLDALDPSEAPGVGTPVKGGLTYREAHLAAEMIASCSKLCSIEFVELNPILDIQNKTSELAVSLICSVLGKRIFKN